MMKKSTLKVIFTLKPNKDIPIADDSDLDVKTDIQNAAIEASIEDALLTEVKVVFSDIEYSPCDDKSGKFCIHNIHDLKYEAYHLCTYVSNYILADCGIDAFDCEKIFRDGSLISVEPNSIGFWKISLFSQKASFERQFNLNSNLIRNAYKFEKFYTNYADGLRAKNLTTKYVQYIKAIEALGVAGNIFDNWNSESAGKNLSDCLSQFDNKYTVDHIKELKDIRNRIEHPFPHNEEERKHISSSDRKLLELVDRKLKDLSAIISILKRGVIEKDKTLDCEKGMI